MTTGTIIADANNRLKATIDEWFYGDADDAASAIREVLDALADRIEAREPYAEISINRYRQVAMHLSADQLEDNE